MFSLGVYLYNIDPHSRLETNHEDSAQDVQCDYQLSWGNCITFRTHVTCLFSLSAMHDR